MPASIKSIPIGLALQAIPRAVTSHNFLVSLQQAKWGHREKFGNDPAKHRDYSAVNHVAKDKGIPPFLILHVAEHPDTAAQAERLEAVLKGAGIPAKRFAARQTDHSKLNESLGLPDDPPTKALFEFVAGALQ